MTTDIRNMEEGIRLLPQSIAELFDPYQGSPLDWEYDDNGFFDPDAWLDNYYEALEDRQKKPQIYEITENGKIEYLIVDRWGSERRLPEYCVKRIAARHGWLYF